MKSLFKALDRALEILAMASFAALILMTQFQVLSRYLFTVPIAFSEELGRFLFIWTSFLGAAIVMRKNEHIKLDLFHGRVSDRAYARLQVFVFAAVALFSLAFFYAGVRTLDVAFKQTASVSRLSMGAVYMILPGSAFFMAVYSISYLAKTIKGLSSNKEAGK